MSNLINTLNKITTDYERLRQKNKTNNNTEIRALLGEAQEKLEHALASDVRHIDVHVSFGAGNLPRTPVIYFFDKRETNTGKEGVYPAIIFSSHPGKSDHGCYTLTLTQGSDDLKSKYPDAYEQILAERAIRIAALHQVSASELLDGFNSRIDGPLKESMRCFEKTYWATNDQDEQGLIRDINNLLRLYGDYVNGRDAEWQELLELSHETDLDTEATVKQRKEQGLLRNHLLKGQTTQACAVCKQDYPEDFLVAAHIKKRAVCSNAERLDFSNVATLMCKAGCDDLFEKQYIHGSEGGFQKNPAKVTTPQLDALIDRVVGNPIDNWETSAHYYAWHADQA